MGLFDPSPSDLDPNRKPRNLQDFAVVIVVAVGLLIYLVIEWLT
jgi:hypothetical protein